MKIAIIGGTGDQGIGLALRFVKAGEKVIIGSRDIKKAENTVNMIKNMLDGDEVNNVTSGTNEDAAKECEIAVLTVPLQAQMATLRSIKEMLENKILIDATVPLDGCLGGKPTRYIDVWQGSAAERSSEFLKDKNVKVVSAFNNISAASLINDDCEVQCDCLISGDDLDSKKEAMILAEKIPGVRAIDCGPLESARIVEKITPLLINLNIKNKIKLAGLRITELD
ncbi:MAG: NADPH-dependent F420 reductase [Methanobacterium sp.]|uniref:NADPH-dependent F420 reductase n=1 Tax=Methanobacterium sp. TaxID=2164 RepID=UPI003D66217A|nr:NADPH-dependent F420 reductase [Methanobacterium sp.]